ncbi:MAG: hypothetical protein KA401_01330 [Anaerolineae bacterium]|nr:hypothetical protein [Chloroflexota bacterium]MBP6297960.1 hypothetical protein [Anaerolineae bacterium]
MADPTVWQRVLSWILPTDAEKRVGQDERLHELTRALERDPESAASYVSRGEVLVQIGEYNAAARDFRRALGLAEAQFKTQTWGVVAQAVRDRALRGLKLAQELSGVNRVGQKTGKG